MHIRKTLTLLVIVYISTIAQQAKITVDSITFFFSEPKIVGQFVNGDYWVLGPVQIDSIYPPFAVDTSYGYTRYINGWEIDPVVNDSTGFDSKVRRFSLKKVPKLPAYIKGTKSVVKVVSKKECPERGECYPALKKAVVLTVVEEIPPNDGKSIFRPPYVAGKKPMRDTSTIDWDFLPRIVPRNLRGTPNIETLLKQHKRVKFDHISGNQMASRPEDNLPNYLPNITQQAVTALAYLCADIPVSEKRLLTIYMVQFGLDWYSFLENGYSWPKGGGEMTGSILPIAFATAILNNDTMKQTIKAVERTSDHWPHENHNVYYNKNGVALYGNKEFNEKHLIEDRYWKRTGSKTIKDPYELIDGGLKPGDYYQHCCTSQPWKGMRMVFKMLGPRMDSIWYNQAWVDYVERWVREGTLSQPDSCAPYDSNKVYGVDYGPDGKGGCIPDRDSSDGIGRFPYLHKTGVDEGEYRSEYIDEIWKRYYNSTDIINKSETLKPKPTPAKQGTHFEIGAGGRINYVIQKSEYVSMKIFNLKGQMLTVLFDGKQKPGNFTVSLHDNKLGSGIFLITLRSGNNLQSEIINHVVK